MCCVYGESGAPLEEEEVKVLEAYFDALSDYLRPEGRKAIEREGVFVIDTDNEVVTPLIHEKECAFTVFENDIAYCAIEKAFNDGNIPLRKPVSCFLYPVRIKKYKDFDAVNLDYWNICRPAFLAGKEKNISLIDFLKEPLVLKYGEEWYEKLKVAARQLEKG